MLKAWIVFCLLAMSLPASAASFGDEEEVVTGEKNFMQTIEKLDRQFQVGSIISVATAELALTQTDLAQTTLTNMLRVGEQECAERFFVTSCLDDQKHWRRKVQDLLKRINIEAKSFLRRQRVAK